MIMCLKVHVCLCYRNSLIGFLLYIKMVQSVWNIWHEKTFSIQHLHSVNIQQLKCWSQRFLFPVLSLLTPEWRHVKGRVNLPPTPQVCQPGVGRSKAGGGLWFSSNLPESLLDPSGPANALSMVQFEEVDDTHFPEHRVSPIMLLISSPLLVSFNFHAKVLASLINRSGHLLAA